VVVVIQVKNGDEMFGRESANFAVESHAHRSHDFTEKSNTNVWSASLKTYLKPTTNSSNHFFFKLD